MFKIGGVWLRDVQQIIMEKFLSVYREMWGLSVLMAQTKYSNCILLYNNCMTTLYIVLAYCLCI